MSEDNPFALLIGKRLADKKSGKPEELDHEKDLSPDGDEESMKLSAASDVIAACKSGDAKLLCSALEDLVHLMKDEPAEEESEPEPEE